MAVLRFVKKWGTFNVGDKKATESEPTVRYLVDVYKVAVIESGVRPRRPRPASMLPDFARKQRPPITDTEAKKVAEKVAKEIAPVVVEEIHRATEQINPARPRVGRPKRSEPK